MVKNRKAGKATKEEILQDLRKIINNNFLVKDFVKIDGNREMYEFCINQNPEAKYTEEDFKQGVDELIKSLPVILGGNNTPLVIEG